MPRRAGAALGVRIIDTRHESAAAHVADACARTTGQPGACVVTGGPGHTNSITGIATALTPFRRSISGV